MLPVLEYSDFFDTLKNNADRKGYSLGIFPLNTINVTSRDISSIDSMHWDGFAQLIDG